MQPTRPEPATRGNCPLEIASRRRMVKGPGALRTPDPFNAYSRKQLRYG